MPHAPLNLKAIALDYDGVIVESNQIKQSAFLEVFSDQSPEIQKKVFEYERVHRPKSRFDKFAAVARTIFGQNEAQVSESVISWSNEYSRLTLEQVSGCAEVPGARDFLDKYSKTCELYLISATPQGDLEKILQNRQEALYFKEIYGAPVIKSQILNQIMKKHPDLLYIGDSLSDHEAAVKAGCSFLGRTSLDQFAEEVQCFPDLIQMSQYMDRKFK